jgi:uncharacterized protein (TIGR02453 family)
MSEHPYFKGFSKKTVDFFYDLGKNNNKPWFDAHKKDYESYVLQPAKDFVKAMGEQLKKLSQNIIAVPKFNKSLFRIYRDTRFSMDKSPYKTYMGIFFWEGSRPRMECSGFYFHVEPPKFMLGVGIYMLPKRLLDRYKCMVVDPKYGKKLTSILKKISKMKGVELGGKHYKRIPSGYDPSHPNAHLLLHNGLYAGIETEIPDELYSSELLDYCMQIYRPLIPLHKWLISIKIGEL